jgi:urease accessory protein
MEQIDGIVGNTDDETLAAQIADHEAAGTLERVVIEPGERKRSRLRVETDAGTDLGLVPDRDLRSGDVLVLEPERAVVVEFERREAAIVDLPEPTERALGRMAELGHRVGNQHWDLAVHDGALYVPVAADQHIVENVLGPELLAGATIRYEEVDPELWLAGDRDGHGSDADHSDGEHSHDHGHDDHSHDHSVSLPTGNETDG